MSDRAADTPRSGVGRADLLLALAFGPRDELAVQDDGTIWLGYRLEPEQPAIEEKQPLPAATPTARSKTPSRRVPLRMLSRPAIVARESREPMPSRETRETLAPLGPDDAGTERRRSVRHEDLVPAARLLPGLQRQLATTRPGALDIATLTRQVASRAPLPHHLPRRRLRRWHPDLVVVLDFGPLLWPFRWDMHRLADRLHRLLGSSGLSLRILEYGPAGPWSDWVAHQDLGRAPPDRAWVMPAAGTPVLLVGDLGLLRGEDSEPARGWAAFVTALLRARTRPIALAPLGAHQLGAGIARLLPVLRWSPDAPLLRAHGQSPAAAEPEGLADLLAMIAVTRRVDPPLLRALRRLTPTAPLDAGLEGAVWCHPDVEAGSIASLRDQPPEARDRHLRHFAELPETLQFEVQSLQRRHHGHLQAALVHEEIVLWASHAAPAVAGAESVRPELDQALGFLERLAPTVAGPTGPSAGREELPDWRAVAEGIVARADPVMAGRHPELFHALLAPLMEFRGDRAKVPLWVDPARLRQSRSGDRPGVRCWVVESAPGGVLRLQAEPPGPRQVGLGDPIDVDAGGIRLRLPGQAGAVWRAPAALPEPIGVLGEGAAVEIETSSDRLVVAAVARPRGALRWSRGEEGLEVVAPLLGTVKKIWNGESLRGTPMERAGKAAWALEVDPRVDGERVPMPTGAGIRWGVDAEFGVYADLEVTTGRGRAEQRLRWIEPGTFLMGSIEDEPARSSDEGPRHLVTLTRGFWLADTACTQAMWQVVTGHNPSHFLSDGDLPVEQVSWDDVQGFLRALESHLPGCLADLPSEAEWEYACRAGTETAFSFGASITPEQVNYRGDLPYAGAAKGLYRRRTVPVRSLRPSPWGLYEMHGNVWEWCADGRRDYNGDAQEDPRGSATAEQTDRAVRGGSWNDVARWARSAFRYWSHPGSRYAVLGFRFCLRSSEPGPAEPVPVRPGRPVAPGGRAEKPPRDAATGFFRWGKRKK